MSWGRVLMGPTYWTGIIFDPWEAGGLDFWVEGRENFTLVTMGP